ncbi:MAG: PilZ domain-containing protein [Marinobacter sp.]|uniref:PilZ domain-containing protein n=1 Tax=Marinobacter sp. TaxID=50741 RepID=UPI00299E40B6|nr:PilZ domain-containing protein [Marinobacter sp.]MDX1633184.1 PilZ domain-containing protein [Marinobacter sp.]
MVAKQPHERRQLRRLPAAELKVQWRPRKGLFGRFRPADGQDFTRAGLSLYLDGDDRLEVGDAIELRIELHMEAGTLGLDKVAAVVRNIREVDDGKPLYGLEFDYNANRTMKSEQTRAQLGRIEGILERSEKLRLRIQPLQDIEGLRNKG